MRGARRDRTRGVLLVLFLLLGAPSARAGDLPTIVVMNFQSGKGLHQDTLKLLNDLMLSEFQRAAGRFRIFGEQDIVSMMNLEETRVQTTGCADDACLAEIGGALGAELLVSASVGTLGDRYVLNMKMIDVTRADAVGRSSQVVEAREAELIAATRRAVQETLSGLRASSAGARFGLVAEAGGRSLAWDVAAWGSAGMALALAAGGTAAAVLAGQSYDSLEDTPQVSTDRRRSLTDEIDRRSLAADVLFGVAGAAALTSVLLFVLMPGAEDGAGGSASATDRASAGLAPVAGGGVLLLQGRLPEWTVTR